MKLNKKGFTLVELLISIIILVVGLVGVLLVIPLGQKTAGRSAMATRAAILAGEKIEELKAKGYEALSSTPFWTGNSEVFDWEASVAEVADEDFTDLQSLPSEGLLKIDLVVSYTEKGKKQEEEFSTFYSEL